jgi:DNA mismatch repair protein MutS
VAVAEEGDRVVFLHHIVPGGADKSYGIHVAQLAGMPRPVIHRAEQILEQLERDAARSPSQAPPRAEMLQLSLFGTASPALEALQSLDVNSLTPIEALTRLYELQRMAADEA